MSRPPKLGTAAQIGIIFAAIGAVGLVVGTLFALRTLQLQRDNVYADGTVVELQERCTDRRKKRDRCTYLPVVEFTVGDERLRVVGSVGSSPPSHDVGEAVRVMYPLGNPHDARIDSWLENWFGAGLGLGFGALFGGVGFPLAFFAVRRRNDRRWAQSQGSLVQTRFVEVMRDTSVKVNGRSPWKIVTQWQNPRDGKVYRFESEELWFDPAELLQGRGQIGVKLDPERPRRYWMDTDFLPEVV